MDNIGFVILNNTGSIVYRLNNCPPPPGYFSSGREVRYDGSPEHVEDLAGQNYVRICWNDTVRTVLPVGSYVEIDKVRYRLLKEYVPQEQGNGGWRYEVEFQHPVMWLGKIPYLNLTGDTARWSVAQKHTDWSLAHFAYIHLSSILAWINRLGKLPANNTETDCYAFGDKAFAEQYHATFIKKDEKDVKWTGVIHGNLEDGYKLVAYASVDVLSALGLLAQEFECEYYLDYATHVIHFGHLTGVDDEGNPLPTVTVREDGTKKAGDVEPVAAELEVNANVGLPQVTEDKDVKYNAWIVKGGTKNMAQPMHTGDMVQTTTRLSLPVRYKDSIIDTRTDKENEPLMLGSLIYDDIYPRQKLYVYDVRQRECWLLLPEDETHKTVEERKQPDPSNPKGFLTYTKWYVKLAQRAGDGWKNPFTSEPMAYVIVKDIFFSVGLHPTGENYDRYRPYYPQGSVVLVTDISTGIPEGLLLDGGDYRVVNVVDNNGNQVSCVTVMATSTMELVPLDVTTQADFVEQGYARSHAVTEGQYAYNFSKQCSYLVTKGLDWVKVPEDHRAGGVLAGKSMEFMFLASETPDALPTPLSGRTFTVVDFPKATTEGEDDDIAGDGFQVEAGDYRIVPVEENGTLVPTTYEQGGYPKAVDEKDAETGKPVPDVRNNRVSLENVVTPYDLVEAAREELLSTALRDIARARMDLNNYTVSSNPVAFRTSGLRLSVGKVVNYTNNRVTVLTHIQKVVTKLDCPWEQELTLGNKRVQSRQQTYKQNVDTLTYWEGVNSVTYNEAMSSGISREEAIALIDEKTEALLRKDKDDATPYSLSIGHDLNVGRDATIWGDVTATNGFFSGMVKALRAVINSISSSNYQGGDLTGTGWQITDNDQDGNSRMEVDNLVVRMKMMVNVLEARKYVALGGNYVYSPAASVIEQVDFYDANKTLLGYETIKVPFLVRLIPMLANTKLFSKTRRVRSGNVDMSRVAFFRCWIKADDGTTRTVNTWLPGMLARCQTMDIQDGGGGSHHENYYYDKEKEKYKVTAEGNKLYWREVIATDQDYFPENDDGKMHSYVDLSNVTGRFLDGSDVPGAGDSIVCYGATKKDYANIIAIETVGEDAPAFKEFRGVGLQDVTRDNTDKELPVFNTTGRMFTKISPTTGNDFYAPHFYIEASNGSTTDVATFLLSPDGMFSQVKGKVDNGKNLLTGVLTGDGWYSKNNTSLIPAPASTPVEVDGDEYLTVTDANHTYIMQHIGALKKGTYTVSFWSKKTSDISIVINKVKTNSVTQEITTVTVASGTAESASATTRRTVTLTVSNDQTDVYIHINADTLLHPQLELGDTATEFSTSATETSSRIKQTANEIEALVNETGVNIQDKTISLYADKVKFYKEKTSATSGDEPKVWIDADDGSLHAEDGHFGGTVRATNFYRGCNVITETDASEWSEMWYLFNIDTFAGKCSEDKPYYLQFEEGAYYSKTEFDEKCENFFGSPYGLGFEPTTYSSDLIIAVNGWWETNLGAYYVPKLPNPEIFDTKIIEFYNKWNNPVVLATCDHQSTIVLGVYPGSGSPSNPISQMTINSGGYVRLVSVKLGSSQTSYWLVVVNNSAG